jgi:hypothetical protein
MALSKEVASWTCVDMRLTRPAFCARAEKAARPTNESGTASVSSSSLAFSSVFRSDLRSVLAAARPAGSQRRTSA